MSEQTKTAEAVEDDKTNGTTKELSALALRCFAVLPLGYPVSEEWAEEWATTEDIQAALNGQEGAEFVAVQLVDEALAELFHVGRVDVLAGEPKKWRESSEEIAKRLASILERLTQGAASHQEFVEKSDTVRADDDIALLVDAGLVEVRDDVLHLATVPRDGGSALPAAFVSVGDGLIRAHRHTDAPVEADGVAHEHIKELAALREKHGAEKRRADDLARWLRQHGIAEHDALDEVRGVVRKAAPTREEFEWTSSRIVDQAEKGVIFGEVLELENEIAAVRLAAEEAAGEHKAKIKGIEAKIRDLKNAAACNQRVVSVLAYKRTNWETKRVIIRAVDDDRVLAEEDLPNGTQRPIPGTDGPVAEVAQAIGVAEEIAGLSDEALVDFKIRAEAKGWKVSLDLAKEGGARVTELKAPTEGATAVVDEFRKNMQGLADEVGATISIGVPGEKPVVVAKPTAPEDPADAPLDASEPGPLASDEQRAAHAKKPKRKAKSGEVRP